MWSRAWATATWPLIRWQMRRRWPHIVEIASAKIILGSFGAQTARARAIHPVGENDVLLAISPKWSECRRVEVALRGWESGEMEFAIADGV